MARNSARGAFPYVAAVVVVLLSAHWTSIAQPQPPATQHTINAICENCGRPYSLSAPGAGGGGGGAGMLRMGFCPACLADDPCSHALEEAQALKDRYRAVMALLAELRRLGPTYENFQQREQAYLDEMTRLKERWASLAARCQIFGDIGDDGPAVRDSTKEERKRDALKDIAEFDRMAKELDRTADVWEHVQIPAGEAVYSLMGEYLPEFVQATFDWVDRYTLGIREGNDRMIEGYHDLADQYREAGAQEAEELASPATSGNAPPPANRDYRHSADVEKSKLLLPKPGSDRESAMYKAAEKLEEARARQKAVHTNLDRYVRARKAKAMDRAWSRAGDAAIGASVVRKLRLEGALLEHELQLEWQKRLDERLTAMTARGGTFKEAWEKVRHRIRDDGLGKQMTETLKQFGADDTRIEKLRQALANTTAEQVETALARQKARLLTTEAIRQELIKAGSKGPPVEPPEIAVLEAQEHFLNRFFLSLPNPITQR